MNEAIRAEFPILANCTYLNSNSTGAFPKGMQQVLAAYGESLLCWRDEIWGEWLQQIQGYGDSIAALIGAPPGSVVTDANLSTLLGRVASCFTYEGERRRVLFADTDFPTVPALWRAFARYGVEPLEVQVAGHSDPEAAILAALDERVKIVCLSHASFRTGALLDVARIAREAHRVGALVVVDAYQSVGTVPVDVEALGADFLLGGAHKWLCGAIESGFLYVRPSLTPSLTPAVTGWMAGADPLSFEVQTEQAPDARRFGAGTPMALPAMLSRVGLDLIHEVGPQAIREHSLSLTDRVLDWAEAEGVQTLTPRDPARRGGVVSLRFAGDREVAQRLVERGMICSWRGALRVAPHFYNTSDEIDRFLAALEAARREVER